MTGASSSECSLRTQAIRTDHTKMSLAGQWVSNTLIRVRALGVT